VDQGRNRMWNQPTVMKDVERRGNIKAGFVPIIGQADPGKVGKKDNTGE
jgi:hypothetical protein